MTVSFKAQIADYEQVLYKQASNNGRVTLVVASNGDVLWPHLLWQAVPQLRKLSAAARLASENGSFNLKNGSISAKPNCRRRMPPPLLWWWWVLAAAERKPMVELHPTKRPAHTMLVGQAGRQAVSWQLVKKRVTIAKPFASMPDVIYSNI